MGIVNGPAPEGRATGATDWMTSMTMERDALQVQLRESELLRKEAAAFSETMRQELVAVTLERDEWKAAAEYQQQQATQLRLQVEALEAAIDDVQGINKRLQQQLADADTQIRQFEQINDETDELQHQNKELQAKLEQSQKRAENNYIARQQEAANRKALQEQVTDLQAQLEAAAVTPSQQPDGTAERLEAVRRMIGEIWGWYACVECLGEQSAETWEQAGALLGRLQREAG